MAIIRYGNHSVIGFGSAGKPQIYFTETSAGIKDWRTGKDSDGRIVLYEYLGKYSASEPLKVPDKYGLTTINDYRSGSTTTASNTPFYNNPNVISVDLKNVPFKNNSMRNAFYNCQNLTSVNGINKNITNMSRTFYECYNLNQNIQIPSSVTNMSETFMFCPNLNQNIQIPSSVTDMSDTFYYCYDLNQNIQIPSSVTNMSQTFSYCYNLNQNIQIPSSVTNMTNAFYNCYNLGTHDKTINILSEEVSNVTNAFYNTSYYNMSNQLTIVFPLRYINNVNTVTRNSLVSAGYAVGAGTGVTAANATEYRNLKCFDWIAGDWNTYSGNGTHWTLTKWNGALTTHFNHGIAPIDLTFPNRLTSYATFPTVINISTYTGNTVINSIKVTKDVPWVSDRTGWYQNSESRGGAFKSCTNLKGADVWINDSVLGMQETFMSCTNLKYANVKLSNAGTHMYGFFSGCTNLYSANTGTSFKARTADINIPDTVTNVQGIFSHCTELSNIYLHGNGITTIAYAFDGCSTRDMNIHIDSPLIATITNWHRGYNASYRRNYYIPYMYANGTYTKTYTTLNAQAVMRNNATSNFYMYDISPYNSVADYVVTFTSPNLYLNDYRGMSETPTAVKKSPFGGTVYMTNTTYTLLANITSVDCNDVPFATTPAYAFRNCHNLTSIKNLNIPSTVSNYQSVFENCSSLRHSVCAVPDGQAQAAYMYKGCTNLGLDGSETIVFGRNVVNFRQTFYGCSNFQGHVYFMCPTGSTSANKWNGTFTGYNASRSKYLWCYFTYSNGVNTATYNLLKGTKLYNNNATSNFYIKDIGIQPLTNNYNFAYNTPYSEIRFIGSCEGSTFVIPSQLEVDGSYADSTPTAMTVTSLRNCFKETRFNRLVQIPSSVTSMAWTFSSCQNLNQNIQIPSSVTNMSGTFTSCTNLNQNIQIPNSVTDMYHTFTSCTNLSSRINILSQNIANAAGCFSSTSLPKDVYIPYTYDNGTYTKTYNSFNSAGYFGGINGVTMHDLNSTSGGGDYDGGGDTDPTPDRGPNPDHTGGAMNR